MSTINARQTYLPGYVLEICLSEITEEPLDAISNTVIAVLSHGVGVAGIIQCKGGHEIQNESDVWVKKYGSVTPAQSANTGSGRLLLCYVIQSFGLVYGDGDEIGGFNALGR